MPPADFRECDPYSPIVYTYPRVTMLHRERTPYQELEVFQHAHFGRVLALDGVVQLTERDEFLYHEMLVQPALHVHPRPREVLILGGGDGGSLRETLKHPEVRRVTVVELDERVVAVSKRFLPALSAGFADPRARVVLADAAAFLERPPVRYDVIIVDSTDPVGPAQKLFTPDFYRLAGRALARDGVFVAQTESLLFHAHLVADVQRALRDIFPIVDCYAQPLATYAGNWWTFSIASRVHSPRRPRATAVPTRYYSREVHRHAFLPRALYRRLLAGTLEW